ncbi:hypothetical protein GCM10009663_59330 [Kitasatospora arboriphila]|uniref:Uncharacterized protein n=1 Tax=Kitasatospora arboriphila TaxID=258052 RepID=A0ABN1TZM9_9ACTN
MPPNSEPQLDQPVAFRPDSLRIHDDIIADYSAGHDEQTPADAAERPGAVPPPAPTRPAPQEPLAARLRAGFGQE